MATSVSGFVLAGGHSSRMGIDKALLHFEGKTLLERALHALSAVCGDVAIVGGTPELARYGRVIPDVRPESGPLSGIVAALKQTQSPWNLFLPVDVPLIPQYALRAMLAEVRSDLAAVMAEAGGRVHPLCAVVGRHCLPELQSRLKAGNLKVRPAIEASGRVALWQSPNADWFANVNTPEDFARLLHPIA